MRRDRIFAGLYGTIHGEDRDEAEASWMDRCELYRKRFMAYRIG
ncbi:MAG: hypothetical protein U0173_06445 [Nitrospiraceae bacterium]